MAFMTLAFVFPPSQPAKAQTFTVLHVFTGGKDGGYPVGPLRKGQDNDLYGAANIGGKYLYGNVFKMTENGKHETILNSFRYWNGNDPNSYLTLDPSGVIYGATFEGGDDNYNGTFYELSGKNKEKVIHQFPYLVSTDGYNPTGPMVVDAQGNFYGATRNGGPTNNGTIFKIDSSGNETVLYNFEGQADGSLPLGLVLGPDGAFYGATSCTYECYSGGGNLFKVDTSGNLTTLYTFTGGADGNVPNGNLLIDPAGNIYGTTNLGGTGPCSEDGYTGCGTIFKLTPGGTESVLYNFQGTPDGQSPSSGVIADGKGNLYGVTLWGGSTINTVGCGVVYELNAAGQEKVLHAFEASDGCQPEGELLLSKNVLYGAANAGGANSVYGAIFKIDLKQ
jgi:uncharacterized repeat protein (TIGR03803 family)